MDFIRHELFLAGTFSVRSLADFPSLSPAAILLRIQNPVWEKALIGRIIKVDEQARQYQLIPVRPIQLL